MLLLSSFIVALTLLQNVLGLERLFFSQCECPNGVFDSVGNTSEVGPFTVNVPAGFDCPINERGVVRDFDTNVISSITGTIDASFFNVDGERTMWYSVFEFDFDDLVIPSVSVPFDLVQFDFPNADTITIQLVASLVGQNSDVKVGLLQLDDESESTVQIRTIDALNRVTIGEYRGQGAYGGDEPGFFFCWENLAFIECADVDIDIGVIDSAVTVTILGDDDDTAGTVRLESMAFEQEDVDLRSFVAISDTVSDDIIRPLADAIDLSASALPTFNDAVIDAVEDVVLENVDLNTFLTGPDVDIDFDIVDPLEITGFGTLSGFNETSGSFDLFTPVENAFGNASFSFNYEAAASEDFPYECVLSVDNAIIEIASAEDVPVLIEVAPISTFAFVPIEVTTIVALSIDFPVDGEAGTLLEGFVVIDSIPSAGSLFEIDCSTNLAVGSSVTLVNGDFQFCYEGNADNLDGETDSFNYTVIPASGLAANGAAGGIITLVGGTPLVVNPDVATRSQVFAEDGPSVILADVAVFGQLAEGVDNIDFEIEILTLPDSTVGVLTNDDGLPLDVGDTLDSQFRFVPTANFFNANGEGTQLNDAGIDLFGNDCEEDDKINEVCPDTFTYQLVFGGVTTENATFGIIVTAVDDASPSFSAEQADAFVLNTLDVNSDGFLTASEAEVEVTSDNGANVFDIGVRFVGIGGVQVQLPTAVAGDPTGFRLDDGGVGETDCIVAACDIMHLVGTPEQLNSFLSKVIYFIPAQEQDSEAPSLNLTLGAGVSSTALSSDPTAYDSAAFSSISFDLETVIDGVLPTDRYFLDQCACLNANFPSSTVDNIGAASAFTAENELSCPTLAQRGFIQDFSGTVETVSGTVAASLFNNDENQRSTWLAAFEVDVSSVAIGETVTVASFDFPNRDAVSVSFENDGASELLTVVFGEFNSISTGFFFCIGSLCIKAEEQAASNGFVGGIIDAPVPVSLLPASSGTGSARLQGMAFTEVTIVDGNAAEIAAILAAFDLDAAALPVFNNEQVAAVEDTDLLNIVLADFLEGSDVNVTFTVTDPFVIDSFGTLSTFDSESGSFDRFTPEADVFGEGSFSFSYEADASENLPYVCQLTVDNVVIDIAPVEDAPELIAVGDLQSVAFVKRSFSAAVAITVDNPDDDGNEGPLLEGFVQVLDLPTAGTLFLDDCETEITLGSVVALNSTTGNFEFCYEGASGNVAGQSDSFTYTVLPASSDEGNVAEGNQTITLLGGNPVVPSTDFEARFEQFTEDSSNNDILVDVAKFVELDPTLDSFDFSIEIVTFPDASVGSIAASANSNTAEFLFGANIVFTPAANFANANGEGGATNDAGENLFGDCEESEQINGICVAALFTYRVLFGDSPVVASDAIGFSVIINAVDDGGAAFSTEQAEPIVVQAVNAREGFIRINGADLEVTSDNGNDIFNVGMRFVGVGGVQLQLPVSESSDPIGFRLDDGTVEETDCISSACDIMHLIGTPSQLNDFVSEIIFVVPETEQDSAPNVEVTLASAVDFDTLRDDVASYDATTLSAIAFEVEDAEEEDGFFDDSFNLALVAGGGGLCLLLIIVIIIVKATTVKTGARRDGAAVTASRKEFKQRGTTVEEGSRKKRSFEEDDDDEENPVNLEDEI